MQFFFLSFENLSALAAAFVTWWWWQNYHLFCFLSLQKPEVKSYGALSREVQKQAWLWKWGTGWLDKRAENLPTAAWTATAQKESEWCWPSSGLLHASLQSSFSPCLSLLSQKLTRMLQGTALTFTGWFAVKKTFSWYSQLLPNSLLFRSRSICQAHLPPRLPLLSRKWNCHQDKSRTHNTCTL